MEIPSNWEKLVDQNVEDLLENLLVLIKLIYLGLFSYVVLTNEMSN